ncbi:hypothetical protein [Sporosarcina sp. NPDC096371]
MKKKFTLVVSAVCLAILLVGPNSASAGGLGGGPWPGCGNKPCYDNL